MLRNGNLGLKIWVSRAAHTQYAYIWKYPPPWEKISSRTWKKSSTADMTSWLVQYCFPAKCFFHVGEQKRVWWCQIRRIWRVSTSSKQSYTAAIATTELCAGALSWWNRTLCQFSKLFWNFSSTTCTCTFQRPKLNPLWVYLQGNNVVSIRKGWI